MLHSLQGVLSYIPINNCYQRFVRRARFISGSPTNFQRVDNENFLKAIHRDLSETYLRFLEKVGVWADMNAFKYT